MLPNEINLDGRMRGGRRRRGRRRKRRRMRSEAEKKFRIQRQSCIKTDTKKASAKLA